MGILNDLPLFTIHSTNFVQCFQWQIERLEFHWNGAVNIIEHNLKYRTNYYVESVLFTENVFGIKIVSFKYFTNIFYINFKGKMIKRPKADDTETDILQMQNEFLAEKEKNLAFQPAAKLVKIEPG